MAAFSVATKRRLTVPNTLFCFWIESPLLLVSTASFRLLCLAKAHGTAFRVFLPCGFGQVDLAGGPDRELALKSSPSPPAAAAT